MENKSSKTSGGCGCGTIGVVIAALISWTHNPSILWAILHGFLGWLYIGWVVLGGQK